MSCRMRERWRTRENLSVECKVGRQTHFFFFQAEDGIRYLTVTEFRRVLFRSPLGRVLEVGDLGEVLEVPRALAAVRGVTPLRGRLVPLIHLGALLGERTPPADRGRTAVRAELGAGEGGGQGAAEGGRAGDAGGATGLRAAPGATRAPSSWNGRAGSWAWWWTRSRRCCKSRRARLRRRRTS